MKTITASPENLLIANGCNATKNIFQNKISKILQLLLGVFVFVAFSQKTAAQIAGWDFAGKVGTESTVAATTSDANLNVGNISRGSGLIGFAPPGGDVYAASGYTVGGDLANAISTNKYLQFTLNAKPGYQASLSTLDANFKRNGTGPDMFQWQYSLDGFTSAGVNIGSPFTYTAITLNGDPQTQIVLSAVTALQHNSNATTITIRLYAWGSTNSSGYFALGRPGSPANDLAIGGIVNLMPVHNISIPKDYVTIQDAINDPLTLPGHIITTNPGTYDEQVTVSKAVTIRGNNNGIAGNGARIAESILTGNNGAHSGFYITASGATIDGFTIRECNGIYESGIYTAGGVTGTQLINNIITDNKIGIYPGGNTLIRDNLFDANNRPGASGGAGIYTESTNGIQIDRNEFKGHLINSAVIFAATAAGVHQNVSFTRNYIHNNNASNSMVYCVGINGGLFKENNITEPGTTALKFAGACANIMVSYNVLANNGTGIKIADDGYPFGANTAIQAHYNHLQSNSIAAIQNDELSLSVNATCNWYGNVSGPTIGTNTGGTGSAVLGTGGKLYANWLNYSTDASANIGVQLPTAVSVAPGSNSSAAINHYRILSNAVGCLVNNQTLTLSGTFNLGNATALAEWRKGNNQSFGDGQAIISGTGDDYSITAPDSVTGVTITAASLGSAIIQGPGDIASVALESALYFNDDNTTSSFQNWTISNIIFRDLDASLMQDVNGSGNTTAFNGFKILNNQFDIPEDLNATFGGETNNFQNIGINLGFGSNQEISGNIFNVDGTGVSDDGVSRYSSTVVLQSTTSGGTVYDGLKIKNNTVNIIGNPDPTAPAVIRGFWENSHNSNAAIELSGNIFANASAGNTADKNRQTAFWVTSRSGSVKKVEYKNNEVSKFKEGLAWLGGLYTGNTAPDYEAGAFPVEVKNNKFDATLNAVTVRKSVASTNAGSPGYMENNSFTNFVSGGLAIKNESSGNAQSVCNWYGTTSLPAVAALNSGLVNVPSILNSGVDGNVATGFQPSGICLISPVHNITQNNYYFTIQSAVSAANNGDTITVAAGTYIENVVVNKSVTILGPNAAIDPCSGVRVAEAIVKPAATVLEPATTGAIFRLGSGSGHLDITIKGLTIDGSNTALSGGRSLNGVLVHTGAGIVNSIGSFDANPNAYDVTMNIQNNIIQNLERYGVLADNTPSRPAVTGTIVSHNKIDNIPSGNVYGGGRGRGIAFEENHYGTASYNCISRVNVGWQDDNYNVASPGAGTVVSDNTISSYHRGIFHNLQYQSATNATISNNIISAESSNNSGTDFGVEIASVQNAVGATVTGNNVTGKKYGILLWNNPTSSTINVSAGVLTNNTYGVYATNYDPQFADGASSIYVIDGINIQNSTTAAIFVDDNAANTNSATVGAAIQGNTIINNASTGLLINGGDASASFNGANPATFTSQAIYINQTSNGTNAPSTNMNATGVLFDGQTGATATLAQNFVIEDKIVHKIDNGLLGFVLVKASHDFVTPNSFVSPATTVAKIQRGVDAASNGFTVNVKAGTYVEDVTVNKQLTMLGAGYATTTVSGEIGGSSNATFLVQSAGVIIDGFTITREGNNPAQWNLALNTLGVSVQTNPNSVEVRNCNITGNRTGIDINNTNGNNIHNNIIDNNRTGIVLRNQTNNTNVQENFITNNWTVGVLFLDASAGTNSPLQQALTSTFNNNKITGNWYGDVQDRQSGGSLPAPGTNVKNFECNWFGAATTPTHTTANSAEPGYAAQIPVVFGGTAVPPAGPQPNIGGTASANVDVITWLVNGTDNAATIGFQPVPGSCTGTGPVTNTRTNETYLTIQAGINDVLTLNGDTLLVAAGTYPENVVVNKSLTILGPNAAINPNTGSRVAEAIVKPAVVETSVQSSTSGTIFRLGAAGHIDVTIKGFTIDGNNSALTGGRVLNGVEVHTGAGITNSIGSFDANPGGRDVKMIVQNNIIKNLERYGVLADGIPSTAPMSGTNVSFNKIDNLPSGNNFGGGRGRGIAFEENHYGTATFNVISRVNVGWQDDNYYLPSPTTGSVISNNTISTYHRGIFHNLQYQNASNATISNNIISKETSGAFPASATNFGIEIASIQTAVGATVTGNNVTGNQYGILLWNNPTSNTITVSGGTLTNNVHGIYVTNDDPQFGAAAASNHIINGVNIQNSTTNGIWVNDNSTASVSAEIKNTTINGGAAAAGILVSGTDASANVHDNPSTITGAVVGVDIDGGSVSSLYRNNITANGTGVRVRNAGTLASATENFITNNTAEGIRLEATAGAIGNINYNDLSGNTGLAINKLSGPTVNAECNWFGTIVPAMVSAKVSANVDPIPWLTNGTDNSIPTAGFQPVPGSCNGAGPVLNPRNNESYFTIQAGINDPLTVNGDTLIVSAGIYTENLTLNKSLTILGPNALINPCSGTRVAEAIIIPATGVATTGAATSTIINVIANNVTVKGFTLDGDNPALTSVYSANGANIDIDMGIAAEASATGNNIAVSNNIIKNVFQFGVLLGSNGGSSKFGVVTNNKIDNVPYWAGVLTYDDYYANIANNCINNAWMGVQVDNYYQAKPGAVTPAIQNNTITTKTQNITGDPGAPYTDVHGIRINNIYQNTSAWAVSGNTMTNTEAGSKTDSRGIELWSIQNAVAITVNNNTINSFETGYWLWNNPSTGAHDIAGGVVNNALNGVTATNYDYYGNAGSSNYVIDNVSIQNGTRGIYVKDDNANTSGSTVAVQIKNNTVLNGNTTGLKIEGADASASFSGATPAAFTGQTTYIDQVTNGTNVPATAVNATLVSFGGSVGSAMALPDLFTTENKINHKIDNGALGFVLVKAGHDFVTPLSFITPATTSAKIQRGVDAASNGFIVNVAAGPYADNVIVNKSVTILGPNGTIDPCSGTRVAEAVVTTAVSDIAGTGAYSIFDVQASNVSIKGLTINGDNTGIPTGYSSTNGADIDIAVGITRYVTGNNLTISHNIIKNVSYMGVELYDYPAGVPSAGNIIANNKIQDLGTYDPLSGIANYGGAVLLYNNQYAAVTNNCMTNVRVGLQTGNFSQESPGAGGVISGNTISARRRGIFHNLAYGTASPFTLSGNTVTGVANANETTLWQGILLGSLNVPCTSSANIINGAGISTTVVEGIDVWNCQTAPVISGGTISGVQLGINVNNKEGYFNTDANNTSATIDGVTITGASTAGIRVNDNPANGNSATVSAEIKGNTNVSGSPVGILVSGSDASANVHDNTATITGNVIGVDADGGTVSPLYRNTISANGTGVRVRNAGTLGVTTENFIINNTSEGIRIEATAGAIGNINNNDLSGNTGLAINNLAAAATNATCNWFGSADAGLVFAEVSSNVNYLPYLNNGTDNDALTGGFQPVPGACAGPGQFYVNDNNLADNLYTTAVGSDANAGTAASPYLTIQKALAVALPGNTIYVDGGVYTTQVDINKSINIQGAGRSGATTTRIKAPASPAAFSNANGSYQAIVYAHGAGNTVNLDSLLIDGDNGRNVSNYAGVYFFEAGGSLTKSRVTAIRDVVYNGNQRGNAVYVNHTFDTNLPHTVTIDSNIVDDYQKTGILLNEINTHAIVRGNIITGQNIKNQNAQNGIQLAYGAYGTITGNTITGNLWNSADPHTYLAGAILLAGAGVDMSNNPTGNATLIGGAGVLANNINGNETGIQTGDGGYGYVNSKNITYAGDIYANNKVHVYLEPTDPVNVPVVANSYDKRVDNPAQTNTVFGSIQYGVDFAAATNTLNASAGTFIENVLVHKPVSINGAGQANTFVKPETTSPNPCPGGGSLCPGASSVFLVQANNVQIQNLTVDGDNPALTGIAVGGADVDARNGIITNHNAGTYNNLNVNSVTVKNVFLRGIYASSGGSFNFNNNTVTNVSGDPAASIAMFNFGGAGIFSNNTVSNSTDGIVSNWSTGTQYFGNNASNIAGIGIHTDNNGGFGGTADLIHNNSVSNSPVGGYGIMVFSPYLATQVYENTITNVEVGLTNAGQNAAVTPIFTQNVIDGQSKPNSIGIYQTTDQFGFGSTNVSGTYTNNYIINNSSAGLRLETQTGFSSNIVANNNSITGNTLGVDTTGTGTAIRNLTCNWWGVTGGNALVAAVGEGTNYAPWLKSGGDASPGIIGFQPNGVCGYDDNLYVNDGSNTGNFYTSATGNDSNPGVPAAPFRSISKAIAVAQPTGNTVWVDAGNYAENLVVNKSISFKGRKAGLNVNPRFAAFTAGPSPKANTDVESVVTAPVSDPLNNPNDLVKVLSNNITFDGFTFDGNNPALAGASAIQDNNSLDIDSRRVFTNIDAANGFNPVNNLVIKNNIMQNVAQRGVSLANNGPLSTGNLIDSNLIRNFGWDPAGGQAVILFTNAYADVKHNTIDVPNDQIGLHLQNFFSNGTMNWSNNNITVGQDAIGVHANLFYAPAGILNIQNNTVNARTGVTSGSDFTWGINLWSVQSGSTVNVTGNTVGNSGGEFARGINLWNLPTSNLVTVSGGTVGKSLVGINLDNVDPYFGVGSNTMVNVTGNPVVTATAGQTGIRARSATVNSVAPGGTVTLNLSAATVNATGTATGVAVDAPSANPSHTATVYLAGGTVISGGSNTPVSINGNQAQLYAGSSTITAPAGGSNNAIQFSGITAANIRENLVIAGGTTVNMNANPTARAFASPQYSIVEMDAAAGWTIPARITGGLNTVLVDGKVKFSNGVLGTATADTIEFGNNAPDIMTGTTPEKASSYILGNAKMLSRAVNNDPVDMLGTVLAGEAGAPANMGNLAINRTTSTSGSINPAFPANQSIRTVWNITPTNITASRTNVRFRYLNIAGNINSQTPASIYSYKYNGATWQKISASLSSAAVGDVLTTTAFNAPSFSPWTLSSQATPAQADLTPLVGVNGASFNLAQVGVNRDFYVSLEEIANVSTSGLITFKIAKPAVFDISFNPIATSVNVGGTVAVTNASFTFTDMVTYYEVTTNASIPASGSKVAGFQIKRKVGVAANTSESISIGIVSGSGGDNTPGNNNTSLQVVAN